MKTLLPGILFLLAALASVQAGDTNVAPPAVTVPAHAPEHARMDKVANVVGGMRPGIPPVERSLTPEQRQQLRAAIEQHRAEITQLNEQARAARQAVLETQLAEKFDEADYLAKTAVVDKLQGQVALIYARAFNTIRPSLTPEQLEQARNPSLAPPVKGAQRLQSVIVRESTNAPAK